MSVAQEDIPATQEKVLERKCDYLEWTKYTSRLHRMDLRLLVDTVSEECKGWEKSFGRWTKQFLLVILW